MHTTKAIILAAFLSIVSGCTSFNGVPSGKGAEYRAEYEALKRAVLSASDSKAEAEAMLELGTWINNRPYIYFLKADSQPKRNGIAINLLKQGEPITLYLHARSDFEPRDRFVFIPKDNNNLFLLEGKRKDGR